MTIRADKNFYFSVNKTQRVKVNICERHNVANFKEEEMTKIYTRLLVFLSVLVCSLCLCLGLAACNPNNGDNTNDPVDSGGEHTHTFVGFWLFDGADGHYQLATCHPTVKSELEPHADENGDFKCDVCDYVLHVHVDEDDDNICDECQTEIHKHTFEEEWTFNENKHWHIATCEHFIERNDYADHSFVNGVCVCGVKESEVKVYALYKNSPGYEFFFTQWLEWLAENGIIEVEVTESGDGIYHYEDGHSEVRFLGNRTVTVKVVADDKPVAHVWMMVSLYVGSGYLSYNGTFALGIGETDENGEVVISFKPINGYSGPNKGEYHVRVAEAKDVAVALGIPEESATPLPNRVIINKGYEHVTYEVNENADDSPVEIKCTLDNGWYNYNKFTLPYKRYYADQLNGEGITETGKTYTFTASGGNLFDYFYFIPSKYNVGSANTTEEKDLIIEYATFAASGTYRIYFEVEGDANAVLYFWDNDVILDGTHYQKADGSPHDNYITSVSGGVAGEGKHTGGNFVDVNVTVGYGLKSRCFGITTDKECTVTLTVVRDENPAADYAFEETEEGKYSVPSTKIPFKATETMVFDITAVPAGLYKLNVAYTSGTMGVEVLYGYVDMHNKVSLYALKTTTESSSNNGVLRISDSDNVLYIQSNGEKSFTMKEVSLEIYEMPELNGNGEITRIPVPAATLNETYLITVNAAPGLYTLTVEIYLPDAIVKNYPVAVTVGGKEYTEASDINVTEYTNSKKYLYTFEVEITENKTSLSIQCGARYTIFANTQLTSVTD